MASFAQDPNEMAECLWTLIAGMRYCGGIALREDFHGFESRPVYRCGRCCSSGCLGRRCGSVDGNGRHSTHRAAYTISLLRADAASDVVDVRGRMAFEWRDDCEGWGVDQLFAMDFAYSTGSSIELRSTYKTWEAKDGSRYSAKVERTRSGDAESHSVDAGPGEAVFKGEETATFALSEGTLFPTAHTLALIEQGLANSRFKRPRLRRR